MFQRLEDVEKRYEELHTLISDPEMIAKQNEWKKLICDTGAAVKINVLVCLMSEDEDYTPTISEIRFKVIK